MTTEKFPLIGINESEVFNIVNSIGDGKSSILLMPVFKLFEKFMCVGTNMSISQIHLLMAKNVLIVPNFFRYL